MAYKYSVKANWGKNANGDSFIRHEDRKMFYIEGFPGDVWVSDDNVYAERWISRISGVAGNGGNGTRTSAVSSSVIA